MERGGGAGEHTNKEQRHLKITFNHEPSTINHQAILVIHQRHNTLTLNQIVHIIILSQTLYPTC